MMNVEVKVIDGFFEKDGGLARFKGSVYTTDQITAAKLQAEGKVKVLREIPSHTPKKEVSHTPKKRY